MDLYDDDVDVKKEEVKVAGWSSGIRMMNSPMMLKKASQTIKARELSLKSKPTLAPVMDFNKKNKKENPDAFPFSSKPFYKGSGDALIPLEPKVDREYDPLWPNEYEKVVIDIKASLKRKDEENDENNDAYPGGGKRPYIARNQLLARQRFEGFSDRNPSGFSGFGGQPSMIDDEELPFQPTEKDKEERASRGVGIAIAPPPSLIESSSSPPPAMGGGGGGAGGLGAPATGMTFAQKLMAKYGYKEGSGLGKNKQGITKSLQVEKTSRRGGRIINEDQDPNKGGGAGGAAVPPPAMYGLGSLVADYGEDAAEDNENEYGAAGGEDKNGGGGGDEYGSKTPPAGVGQESEESDAFQGFKQPDAPAFGADDNGFKVPTLPFGGGDSFKVPFMPGGAMPAPPPPKPSVTELIKNPTRVVLMKNMVGPGEVDEELEPEVKEECETKYGEIVTIKILEKENVPEHEVVQIYLEFKRIECAIKALVDLNGRFFGGREVHAAFINEAQYLAGDI